MKEIIKAFKALSDPTRLRIFLLLLEKDLCVCELTYVLDMSQSRVSHQLRLLRDADLVEDKRDGRWIIYTIPRAARRGLGPLLRRLSGPDLAETKLIPRDIGRLDLCLRQNLRKVRRADPHQPSA
ncbi:MAG TPA: metalloregulator ArsR/SmtB family transcription factor [Candidatus Aminicenantes bacterium]|nr:metalloregulator ArsR/SmtB family transcription factor [Candidatus Aminicenantes bacterium]HRY63926.1 metalloregulator ArsR/SmtB family transcription factor [Candidatus Aminicenantes bacterium]HRZ70839.1 metalloregulator ArsR/SmtB family transcription factor [Candidatus Aminicenantes bacterium]